MATNIVSRFLKSETGALLHYTSCGAPDGQLTVLLHGLGGSTETFRPLLNHLVQKGLHVVSLDFEGSGRSKLSTHDAALSVPRFLQQITELLQHLQRDPSAKKDIVLIGHSLGSIIALNYASKTPENVAALILLGVGRSASHIPAVKDRMEGLAQKVRSEGILFAAVLAETSNFPTDATISANIRNQVKKAVAGSDPEGYARTCELIVRADHKDPDYAAITCPVLFISGQHDPLSPPHRARDLASLVAGTSLVRVVGEGHHPILEDIEGVQEAIDEIL